MATYSARFIPFNSDIPEAQGRITVNISGSSATVEVDVAGHTYTLNATVTACGNDAQIISTTGLAPKFVLFMPSAKTLQAGLVGFYVTALTELGLTGAVVAVITPQTT